VSVPSTAAKLDTTITMD